MQRSTATLLLMLAVCASGSCAPAHTGPVSDDATAAAAGPRRGLLGLNHTCYKLCKAGQLPASLAPAAGAPATAAAATTPAAAPAATTASVTPPTAAAAAATPAAGGSSTAATTSAAPSTACVGAAPTDPAVLADALKRAQNAKLALTMSDMAEVLWSTGNLYSALTDMMKQALAAAQSGELVVDAQSVLLFNSNLASITAFWASTVQNLLLLRADQLRPIAP
jgi:hypothetical protein